MNKDSIKKKVKATECWSRPLVPNLAPLIFRSFIYYSLIDLSCNAFYYLIWRN